MTTFIGWTPPPGVAVVDPPVANWQEVDLIFSDRSELKGVRAGSQNWSSVGDGPSIVAYAVVSEYKPAPEPLPVAWKYRWKIGGEYVGWRYSNASNAHSSLDGFEEVPLYDAPTIHVREVPDPSREVVVWALIDTKGCTCHYAKQCDAFQAQMLHGGAVIKLTGVMP